MNKKFSVIGNFMGSQFTRSNCKINAIIAIGATGDNIMYSVHSIFG